MPTPRPPSESSTRWSASPSQPEPSGTHGDASVSHNLHLIDPRGLRFRGLARAKAADRDSGLTSPSRLLPFSNPTTLLGRDACNLSGAPPPITQTHEYQALENEWMRERNVSSTRPSCPMGGRPRGKGRAAMAKRWTPLLRPRRVVSSGQIPLTRPADDPARVSQIR